ncbi:Zn finger protein HypA/HybF involved in hydrogenase expression [Anoxybacillus calidus]|uniref:Zn finger protein HypA/HybF involved in hydrogenase expression n=1 Tax=[Anoxybacillus] calidus TaxID=575178 RepID=A0A7V9Z015_9BACL|nr:Zn finger protein HypA/HybF involved in hydrogenase expression [Anoxybacillus calidus]
MPKPILCERCQQPVRRLKHSILCQCGPKILTIHKSM